MNAKELYTAAGKLSLGFQGHIAYSFLLPVNVKALDISFEFDKREPLEHLEEWKEQGVKAVLCNIPGLEMDESMERHFLNMPKSEINVSVFHNGFCLGSAHRNLLLKEIRISPEGSSEGFLPWKPEGGNIRIVLHVLNVLNNDTNYSLTVKGESHDI